jgi:hypothetical protein
MTLITMGADRPRFIPAGRADRDRSEVPPRDRASWPDGRLPAGSSCRPHQTIRIGGGIGPCAQGRPDRCAARQPPNVSPSSSLQPWQREHLVRFAVRVGARRLADASVLLAQIGQVAAAGIADRQARLVGALQHPLVTDDRASAAMALRELAPTHGQMAEALGGRR